MKRVFLGLLLCAGFLAFDRHAALAVTEFCPAQLNYEAVGEPAGPTQLYSFVLEAYGPRTVVARLGFHTGEGWYTLALPNVALTEKDVKYYTPASSFIEKLWVSPTMYADFASPVTVKSAWVRTAESQGDSFGWDSKGVVDCPPGTQEIPSQQIASRRPPWLITHDFEFLKLAPASGEPVLNPQSAAPFEKTDCPSPFQDPTVTYQAQPNYPSSARALNLGTSTVNVVVAVRADGSLADAWIFGSSGVPQLDNSALDAARKSEYRGAVAFCQAVPGYYYFRVTYNPQRY